jgi:hypothetical protein
LNSNGDGRECPISPKTDIQRGIRNGWDSPTTVTVAGLISDIGLCNARSHIEDAR